MNFSIDNNRFASRKYENVLWLVSKLFYFLLNHPIIHQQIEDRISKILFRFITPYNISNLLWIKFFFFSMISKTINFLNHSLFFSNYLIEQDFSHTLVSKNPHTCIYISMYLTNPHLDLSCHSFIDRYRQKKKIVIKLIDLIVK